MEKLFAFLIGISLSMITGFLLSYLFSPEMLLPILSLSVITGFIPSMIIYNLILQIKGKHPNRPCFCRNEKSIPKNFQKTRITVGVSLLILAIPFWFLWIPISLLFLWLAISHVIAAHTFYLGCPELGAIPNLFFKPYFYTGCGPWCDWDRKSKVI